MNKKLGYSILILLVIVFAIYRYTYQEHRNINSEKVSYTITIPELEKEFAANDSMAFAKYQDKTIELTAKITAVDFENKAIILENKVFATFNDSLPKGIISGKTATIKGRFLGYDELLEEFKIDQSSIIR
ncbi:hypothetical protein [Flavobacterium seoulense]|uniref:tRNA_anti-like n=1 Tax=Flavobacterium seoulense TaxID=1492738 RepID=A0A066WND5_9FLAO|nr:hypothetical protein [Flavobacterium seoulense]KDN54118.1 hypothetical protein FEM21_27710 [Flavobacterium seoulense]